MKDPSNKTMKPKREIIQIDFNDVWRAIAKFDSATRAELARLLELLDQQEAAKLLAKHGITLSENGLVQCSHCGAHKFSVDKNPPMYLDNPDPRDPESWKDDKCIQIRFLVCESCGRKVEENYWD